MTTTVQRAEPQAPATAEPRRMRNRKKKPQVGIYILILALSVFFIGPFIWLLLAALKTPGEWTAVPVQILPSEPQWNNFVHALTDMNVNRVGSYRFLCHSPRLLARLMPGGLTRASQGDTPHVFPRRRERPSTLSRGVLFRGPPDLWAGDPVTGALSRGCRRCQRPVIGFHISHRALNDQLSAARLHAPSCAK